MAGLSSYATSGYIDVIFECYDESQATALSTLITTNMMASGSYDQVVTTISDAPGDGLARILTTRVPQEYLENQDIMNVLVTTVLEKQIVPVVKATAGTHAGGIVTQPVHA